MWNRPSLVPFKQTTFALIGPCADRCAAEIGDQGLVARRVEKAWQFGRAERDGRGIDQRVIIH